jgi:hypothetical protein
VDAAVLRVLHDTGRGLVKSEILDQLALAGVPRPDAEEVWPPVQKRLRLDKRVITQREGQIVRYRWNPTPPPAPDPAAALALLVEGRLTRGEREALAEAVRSQLAPSAASDGSPDRIRQVELDVARELVGLAAEVEEQVAKGASAKAIVHKVRARMKRLRLEALERAGETVSFDRDEHQPLRAGIPAGARVLVVRPGYVWRVPGGDLVIEQPVVQD